MDNERELELERKLFKVIEDAGCGDQGEVFIGTLKMEELEAVKIKAAIEEMESLKEEFGPDSHDQLDTEIEVMEELIEKLNRPN